MTASQIVPSLLNSVFQITPVNRETQREEFLAALSRIRMLGSIFETVMEWYGSPGSGKTTLVAMLSKECLNLALPYTLIDFNTSRSKYIKQSEEDKTFLVAELTRGLEETSNSALNSAIAVHEAIAEYQAVLKEGERAQQIALNRVGRAFIAFADDLMQRSPIVLLFDETERATAEMMAWLEEWVISPLVQRGRCLIVWTGRRPQRWKRFEVRRRLVSQELELFDDKALSDLFKKNSPAQEYAHDFVDLSGQVGRVTGGHPLASALALVQLKDLAEAGKGVNAERFSVYEPDLLDNLVQNFVEEYAFRDVDAEELRAACRILSLLRQFDVILLREVLKSSVPDFAQYETLEFSGVLTRLRQTQLVIWDSQRKGYALDRTLRRVLGEYIYRRQPELYHKANTLALRTYHDWVRSAGDNSAVYIVETLYHQACLNRPESAPVDLVEMLTVQLRNHPQADLELRSSALERLEHELDDDLELADLVGKETWEQLIAKVQLAIVDIRRESTNEHLTGGLSS